MNKITLKINEVYELNTELNGIISNKTGEVIKGGLLGEKLNITVKYWLTKLNDELRKHIDSVENLKEDLIKKIGNVDKDGNIFIPMRINEVFDKDNILLSYDINPTFIEFQKEFEKLLQEEVEITYRQIKLEDISIETEITPNILFKLIQKPAEESAN